MIVFDFVKIAIALIFFPTVLCFFLVVWLGLTRIILTDWGENGMLKALDYSAKQMERTSPVLNKAMFVDGSEGWPNCIERCLMMLKACAVLAELTYGIEHVVHHITDTPKSNLEWS